MPMAADPNSFDCTVVQACAFYDESYYIDDLRIVEFVKFCYVTWWILSTFFLSLYRNG